MKYETHTQDSVVLKENEPSNGKMYIILKGSVNVLVKSLDFYTKKNMEEVPRLRKVVN